jgi:hypothetical protein
MAPPRFTSNVAIFSTQFITTLSALAVVAADKIESPAITIYSIRHPSFSLHSNLIAKVIIPWCLSKGWQCRIVFIDDMKTLESHSDLLITPRIDHRLSVALINQLKPTRIIETGESIGVEPKLYSFKSRMLRRAVLKRLQADPTIISCKLAHFISISSYNPERLHVLLEICLATKQAFCNDSQQTNANSLFAASPPGSTLLLFPYLTHPTNKKLFPKLYSRLRKWLGIKPRDEQYLSHIAIDQAAQFIAKGLKDANADQPAIIYLKPHPKNFGQIDQISRSLQRKLGNKKSCFQISPISADLLLEQIVSELSCVSHDRLPVIIGFGTNLLAAELFLYPFCENVKLVSREEIRLFQFLDNAFQFAFHRTEFLRRRHVSRLMASLRSGLEEMKMIDCSTLKSS